MKPRCKVVLGRLNSRTKKYFTETTLHGFCHITDPKSSKFKSYFWAIVCAISTCLCILLIWSQFHSYYSNRITTTIQTTAFPIWEVPFPAVTICNFNMVYRDRTSHLKKLLEKYAPSEEVDSFFANLSSLVLANKVEKETNWKDYTRVTRLLERAGYNSDTLMALLAHPCNNMITDCLWNGKQQNCSDIFHLIKTNVGYCCSFNYRAVKSRFSTDEAEYFVTGVGPSYGLYVHLNTEEDQYLSSFKHSLGIDVSVHENVQYPDMSIYSTTVRPGNDVSLSVKPEVTESEDNVRGTEINARGCAFPDEIKMAWTKIYSYTTCMNECKAKAIKELCGCVPFYYYPIRGKTRFCTLPDMACIKSNSGKFKSPRIASHYFHGKTSVDNLKCKCYPSCNEVTYSYQQDLQPLKITESEMRSNQSILRVYFGHVSCTKLVRRVFITWELILGKNLIWHNKTRTFIHKIAASVGGLIGLCLGGSILSIIEFLYHIVETLFSRYNTGMEKEPKKYQPKLYLTDFKNLTQNSTYTFKFKNNKVK